MNKRVYALWHTNLKNLEINQKVLTYCSCNNHQKIRQHKVSKIVKDFYFLKCCNCNSINVEYHNRERKSISHLGVEKNLETLIKREKHNGNFLFVNYGLLYLNSYLNQYR